MVARLVVTQFGAGTVACPYIQRLLKSLTNKRLLERKLAMDHAVIAAI